MARGRADQVSHRWTPEKLARAVELRKAGANCSEIDRQLGLPQGRTWTKLRDIALRKERAEWRAKRLPSERLMPRKVPPRVRVRENTRSDEARQIPVAVLAERDARAARPPVSLTALLMGDPVRGRSALDRR